jgi:hypothetical protein
MKEANEEIRLEVEELEERIAPGNAPGQLARLSLLVGRGGRKSLKICI